MDTASPRPGGGNAGSSWARVSPAELCVRRMSLEAGHPAAEGGGSGRPVAIQGGRGEGIRMGRIKPH